jgi:choline transport protein
MLMALCLLNNTYGFMGTDAGAHLAEEVPSPSINAPKVIVRGRNFLLGKALVLT